MKNIKKYYQLIKPGIVYGNVFATIAGFFFASSMSKGKYNWVLFLATVCGVALIIASACVWNNLIDQDIDKKMSRTKNRPLVHGDVSSRAAEFYAMILGLLGFGILLIFTNLLTVCLGAIGFFGYVIVYGIAKRRTIYSTLIGSIPGAMPLIAGYTAVVNRVDIAAIVLFLMMGFWQIPHFYAIALYRIKDYANAGLLLWPIKKGVLSTKISILVFICTFFLSGELLYIYRYKHAIYAISFLVLNGIWIGLTIKGFFTKDTTKWAKTMFFFSLLVLFIFSLLIALPL